MLYRFFPLCLLLLAGCVTEYPEDLTFVSIEEVEEMDMRQFRLLKGETYGGFYGRLMEQRKGMEANKRELQLFLEGANGNLSNGNRRLLKVAFKTKENLFGSLSENSHRPPFPDFYFCENPELRYGLIIGRLFWEDSNVPYFWDVQPIKDSEGFYTYYQHVLTKGASDGIQGPLVFDLEKEPEDICFVLRNIDKLNWGTISNEAFLSKEVIQQELDR